MNDWVNQEPSWLDSVTEGAHIIRRGLARPVATVALTLLVGAAVVFQLLRPRPFEASVVLRMSESSLSEKHATLAKHDLRGWIEGAALSGGRLIDIAHEHHLYANKWHLGEEAVREAFRDDLTIQIANNYFLVNRTDGSGLRSARIEMTYKADDPKAAEAIVLTLAKTVVDYENRTRRDEADGAIAAVDAVAAKAIAAVTAKEEELGRELARAQDDTDSVAHVRAYNLSERVAASQEALSQIATLRQQTLAKLEDDASALSQRIEIVHVQHPELPRTPRQAGVIATVAMLLAIPLCAMAAGAFDSRIRTIDECLTELERVYSIPSSRRNA